MPSSSFGWRTGAFAVSVVRDDEGLPSRDDLALYGKGAGTALPCKVPTQRYLRSHDA
jgi:hypothetical protein